jgi:hypothetical protein
MARPLTQVQLDLSRYAQQKTHTLILDVVQAFDIAGEPRADALACIGSALLRIGATLAVHAGADRERWLKVCNEVYELARETKEENP